MYYFFFSDNVYKIYTKIVAIIMSLNKKNFLQSDVHKIITFFTLAFSKTKRLKAIKRAAEFQAVSFCIGFYASLRF